MKTVTSIEITLGALEVQEILLHHLLDRGDISTEEAEAAKVQYLDVNGDSYDLNEVVIVAKDETNGSPFSV